MKLKKNLINARLMKVLYGNTRVSASVSEREMKKPHRMLVSTAFAAYLLFIQF